MIGSRLSAGGPQIVREIGRGSRGTRVYLASDGRSVFAVKVYPEGAEARAVQEVRVGAGLRHPNLNPVHERLQLAGRPAVTMPALAGPRLGSYLHQRPWHQRQAAIDGLLGGLAELHRGGVVHRDVKPDNVIVRDGTAVLLDYDLAVRIDEANDPTATAGSPAFLSPEHASGAPASPASDLYAVGVLLYLALTDAHPFEGWAADGGASAAGSRAPYAPPSTLRREAAPFDELVAGLLAADPAHRYADAEAVRAELRRLGADTADSLASAPVSWRP